MTVGFVKIVRGSILAVQLAHDVQVLKIMNEKNEISEIAVVKFQFLYMLRPNLHVKERFFEALAENIKNLKLPDRLEIEFLTLAIKAFGSKLRQRQELCSLALDALDALYPPWQSAYGVQIREMMTNEEVK